MRSVSSREDLLCGEFRLRTHLHGSGCRHPALWRVPVSKLRTFPMSGLYEGQAKSDDRRLPFACQPVFPRFTCINRSKSCNFASPTTIACQVRCRRIELLLRIAILSQLLANASQGANSCGDDQRRYRLEVCSDGFNSLIRTAFCRRSARRFGRAGGLPAWTFPACELP
jgi:hypothetical protein